MVPTESTARAGEGGVLDRTLLTAAARLLGLMDRCPWSRTFGCLDRPYWHYRILTDFAGAGWQQPLAGFALLYANNFPGNIYHRSESLRSWIDAGISWWSRIQNGDGSFSEWYLRERSFCATAFTSWAAARTLETMRGELSPGTESAARRALERSGDWLLERDNPLAGNQRAAALAALAALVATTGAARFRRGYAVARERLLASQSPEGWFPEHGGADPGYGFVTLDILAETARITGDAAVTASGTRLLDWLLTLVHPDGSVGGPHSSRGGRMFLPGGLFTLPETPRSRRVKRLWLAALISGAGLHPLATDDRYLAYFHFNSLAAARTGGSLPGDGTDADDGPAVTLLPEAGLLTLRDRGLFLLIGLSSGGTILLYQDGRLRYADCGYVLENGSGDILVSHGHNPAYRAAVHSREAEALRLTVTTRLRRWPIAAPAGGLLVPFGIATRTVLRSTSCSSWLATRLRNRVFLRSSPGRAELTRDIALSDGHLVVTDLLTADRRRAPLRLARAPLDVAGHSPAGRDFTSGEITAPITGETLVRLTERLTATGSAGLRTIVDLGDHDTPPLRQLISAAVPDGNPDHR